MEQAEQYMTEAELENGQLRSKQPVQLWDCRAYS